MEDSIFVIKNLKCSYNGSNTVLQIDDLTIPRGKISFLLGVSGSGKSTFLETLGIMNNSIQSGTVTFYPENNNLPILINELWDKKYRNKIAAVRNKYLSFIFQSTNLMPNFTALENICISQLIQEKSFNQAKEASYPFMEKVGIHNLEKERESVMFSGGEQQRIAFVRAISPSFSVIFGDEPTGNLDDFNANELMQVLKEKTQQDNKTAIIVSHNITLASNYADCIYILTKKTDKQPGVVLSENSLYRSELNKNTWFSKSGKEIRDVKRFLEHALINNNTIEKLHTAILLNEK